MAEAAGAEAVAIAMAEVEGAEAMAGAAAEAGGAVARVEVETGADAEAEAASSWRGGDRARRAVGPELWRAVVDSSTVGAW